MKLVLKRLSQEAGLENIQDIKYFLVFEVEGESREIRLPVQSNTAQALLSALYVKDEIDEPQEEPDAEEFKPEIVEDEVEPIDENGIPSI